MLSLTASDFLSRNLGFWSCAIAGTALFFIQFLLNLWGFDSEEGHFEADSFQWFSKQSLTGFLMIFGWIGLACKEELTLSNSASLIYALAAGIVTMLITSILFRSAKKLRSSGSIFRIEDTLGKEAIVYQRISMGVVGKITISQHNITHEIDALSDQELTSFSRVRVVKIADEKTVLVEPCKY